MTPDFAKDLSTLNTLLDHLIPAGEERRVPSASQLGVAQFLLKVVASEPDLATALDTCLTQVKRPVDLEAVRVLEHSRPAAFATVLRHAYMGYYSQPASRSLFGLSPLPTQPTGYSVLPESADLLEELVGPVLTRGPCYRTTNGDSHDT
ncbi:MAG: hypothetical protein JXR13_18840 [Thalassovita sp.]